jgi:hypothetical protein
MGPGVLAKAGHAIKDDHRAAYISRKTAEAEEVAALQSRYMYVSHTSSNTMLSGHMYIRIRCLHFGLTARGARLQCKQRFDSGPSTKCDLHLTGRSNSLIGPPGMMVTTSCCCAADANGNANNSIIDYTGKLREDHWQSRTYIYLPIFLIPYMRRISAVSPP